MQGLFSLKTAADLRDKLRRDLARLEAASNNADVAFDFFVTAEHLPDWAYPDDPKRRSAVRKIPLLATCSHLANGAKHFEATDPRHKSVQEAKVTQGWGFDNFGFDNSAFNRFGFDGFGFLVVTLDGDAARELGRTIGILDLARRIMAYWDGQELV